MGIQKSIEKERKLLAIAETAIANNNYDLAWDILDEAFDSFIHVQREQVFLFCANICHSFLLNYLKIKNIIRYLNFIYCIKLPRRCISDRKSVV